MGGGGEVVLGCVCSDMVRPGRRIIDRASGKLMCTKGKANRPESTERTVIAAGLSAYFFLTRLLDSPPINYLNISKTIYTTAGGPLFPTHELLYTPCTARSIYALSIHALLGLRTLGTQAQTISAVMGAFPDESVTYGSV